MLSNQLIITIAGKKGGGKNTLGNFCTGYYLRKIKAIEEFRIEKDGTLSIRHGPGLSQNIKNGEFNPNDFEGKPVKLYSFADPLKQFCIDTLGLTFEQCYGTDTEKNELTHCTRKCLDPYDGYQPGMNTKERLTAREVMQIFGTEFVRSLWQDAWAFSTYKKIKDEGHRLAIITDARFPNEVEMGKQYGAKAIKLERSISTTDLHPSETALGDYADENFDSVIHNANMSIKEQNYYTQGIFEEWLKEIQ